MGRTYSNKKKKEQLGMASGTAAVRLKKQLMFRMMQELEWDNCYRCGEKIEDHKDMSVEHKIPWLDSDDPLGLYFDLNNVAFSHLSCNSRAGKKGMGGRQRDRPIMVTLTCNTCSKKFDRKAKNYRYALKQGQENFYCSISCGNKNR